MLPTPIRPILDFTSPSLKVGHLGRGEDIIKKEEPIFLERRLLGGSKRIARIELEIDSHCYELGRIVGEVRSLKCRALYLFRAALPHAVRPRADAVRAQHSQLLDVVHDGS
jgi:hypothetical protein